jgi:hypothetical protein
MVAGEREKGHSKFLLKRRPSVTTGAKILQPVVLPDLQGNGLCVKKPFG